MLNNVFQKNRWDYLYSNQPSREDRVQKQLSLFFKDDQIVGMEGDFRPGAIPVVKTSGETTVDVPKRDLDKTLWEKITGLFGYDELDATPKSDKTETKKSSENNLPL